MKRLWLPLAAALLFMLTGRTEAFCPAKCACDDDTLQVTCESVALEVIPITLNPSVQRLVLKRSKIKSIDTALRFYLDLLYIDFSHSTLVTIEDKSFDSQKKLTELRLGFNKISSVTNGTWMGLHSLKVLSLRKNYLGNLGERTFATASQLRELDLGENSIEYLHPEALAGLPNLRILYLDSNKLGDRDPSWPLFMGQLTQLAELSLAGNELKWLGDGLFNSLTELSQLDLSGCKIYNVSSSAFEGLDQLRGLKMNSNPLTAVPSHAWSTLVHLESLALGQNNLTFLNKSAFAGLGRLKSLDIHDAPQLTDVNPEALMGNRDLVQLRLTQCKHLTSLPQGLFSYTTNLRRLELRDNGFLTLPDKVFHLQGSLMGQSLQVLDLSGNPFRCDCQIQWLRDYLLRDSVLSSSSTPARMRRTIPSAVDSGIPSMDGEAALELVLAEPPPLMCASPPLVADKPLQSLTDDQLGCRTSFFAGSSSPSLIIGLSVAGGLAVLFCLIFLICRYRRRIAGSAGSRRGCCCRPSDAKPHPKYPEDSRTLASKWKPASPTTWGATIHGNHHHHHHPLSSGNSSGTLHQYQQHQQQTVSLIGGRTPEYHKACTNEEECFMRAVTLHNNLKPFPRTEL